MKQDMQKKSTNKIKIEKEAYKGKKHNRESDSQ